MPIPTRSLSLRGQSKQSNSVFIPANLRGYFLEYLTHYHQVDRRTHSSEQDPTRGGRWRWVRRLTLKHKREHKREHKRKHKHNRSQEEPPPSAQYPQWGSRSRSRWCCPGAPAAAIGDTVTAGKSDLDEDAGSTEEAGRGRFGVQHSSASHSYAGEYSTTKHKDGNESGREGCYNAEERDVQRARIVDLSDEKGWGCVNVPEENGDAAAGAADSVGVDETAFESWHVRHRSQIVAPSSSQGQVSRRSDSESSGSTPMTTPGLAAGTRPSGQFTTYQQQFSPRKVVRPAASSVASASAHGEDSLIPTSWPEIAALQTELLQLSLLHSSSLQQMAALEAESEEQLQTKYDAVAKTYRAMVGEEKKRQRLLNGQALNRWLENASEHGGRPNFAAQIQAFSQLVQEVCDLTDSLEGKYTMLVQKFEEWFRKVQAIESMRLHRQQGDANHVVFIDPLDRVWKDEVHVMIVKLEQGLRQLQSLDITDYDGPEPALADAALVRTAKGLDVMIASMVDELKVILASTVPSTSAAAVYWQRSEI
ncbi:hypothetical protein KXW42_009321 [Aspergillus fumigatus]|nr:hypothetical protein KXW66_009093 [Aspergillus fumigatus]KAH3385092.1 hypothetical protein KXW42_009321 [Aspergillus fumigatus]